MSSKQVRSTLDYAKEAFENKKQVAFLGPPNCGKTVVAVLMKDAIFAYYQKEHPDVKFNVIKGNDFLVSAEENMFSKGEFPIKTPTFNPDEIVYQIREENAIGDGIALIIRDMSGEDYESAFLGQDMEPIARVNHILDLGRAKQSYGPIAYSLFSKMYIILIDCSEFSKWRTIQTRNSQLLNSLYNVKAHLGKTNNDKFDSPIAIVLTKADELEQYTELSPEELIKKHMPQFHETLYNLNDGTKEFFKLSIDLQSNQENVIERNSQSKIKIPISYSNEEYVKLTDWIIQNLSR